MNGLSLFSGIGGMDLGLERAGIRTVGQVEIDPWCRRVLARHWPDVPRHDDVRTAAEWWLSKERPHVDVVFGGPPCQPFSRAGRRRGVGDQRWGWPWMAAVVRLARPRYVVVENVAALLDDGDAYGWILADLAALGFDAEWSVLSACALGAPHPRERLFVVAYPYSSHGSSGLGHLTDRPGSLQSRRLRARTWREEVDRSLAPASADDRETDGSAGRMVAAGGNAVVVDVAEHIGRLIGAAS